MDSKENATASSGSSKLDESSVTMLDVLNEQNELEAESDAVLGGSDEKNCTYALGYIVRQALYACVTCSPESAVGEEKRAGVCLACSYQCHEGHELVELYTKRNFRCDCGGKRMPDVRCKLDPIKLDENEGNQYNQNFGGLYCTCHRPYPDPEDTVHDEMIQCVVCEDWYHTRHLENDEPKNSKDYAEMVCHLCMERVVPLRNYVGKLEDCNRTLLNETVQLDVTGLDDSVATAADTSVAPSESEEDLNESKRIKLDICTKPAPEEGDKAYKKGATFWHDGWRKQLCRCTECMECYRKLKVEFLLDEKDTVQWYEENGRAKREENGSTYEQGMQMWNKMGRVQQVEILSGYNLMKDRLASFLDTFVTNQQVVTEKDIKEFFEKLNKERRETNMAPPSSCR
ncbi:putative E3 ubiquitin-protein ligase UBR7 [Culex pipiens pallens]|uniref:putative E3 ubiquitin-protein ligase UBR7 n=1 Tax=Culex pipiens pallens TaxID=42434 RepID=UPI0019538EFF|nr:putative E3 ubiquitin-protein ligase UBR7 [Culex pipiens pallens]